LFFLDYLASGKLDPEVTESVVSGLAEACKANGCVLIGGETAQMPGFYTDGEYDLAGFIVGAVDRDKMVTGAGIKAGDVLVGLPSTGLHTNGYSLARKLLFEVAGYKPAQYVTAIKEKAGAALMKTHRSYLSRDSEAGDGGADHRHGAHHRRRHHGEPAPHPAQEHGAQIEIGSWPVLPIFEHLRELGQVSQEEMMRTFNMGIGLIAAIPAAKFTRAKNLLDRAEEKFYVIGRVVKGERRVQYTGAAERGGDGGLDSCLAGSRGCADLCCGNGWFRCRLQPARGPGQGVPGQSHGQLCWRNCKPPSWPFSSR
jgi:phosphoribosylformylglycinamidine cyclo-ligase